MKKLLILAVMAMFALILSSNAFAAAILNNKVLLPGDRSTITDTTWADLIDEPNDYIDLYEFLPVGYRAVSFGVVVTKNDADVDSIVLLARTSMDGVNWVVIDSNEVTGSTLGSAYFKTLYDTSSASVGLYRYFQVVARVWGDGAGTAIQTIGVTTFLHVHDGNMAISRTKFYQKFGVSVDEIA